MNICIFKPFEIKVKREWTDQPTPILLRFFQNAINIYYSFFVPIATFHIDDNIDFVIKPN